MRNGEILRNEGRTAGFSGKENFVMLMKCVGHAWGAVCVLGLITLSVAVELRVTVVPNNMHLIPSVNPTTLRET